MSSSILCTKLRMLRIILTCPMKLIQYICKFSNVQHGLATVKSAPHEIVIIIKKMLNSIISSRDSSK